MALVSSAGLYSETTSNEYSATARAEDRVEADAHGHHSERLHRGRGRMLAAQVGDDAVQAHVGIHNRSWRACAEVGTSPGNTLNSMGVDTGAKAAVKKPAAHPNTWVFFEGDFARYNDVKLGLMTHALHYGTAVFEGIRAYWNDKKGQLYLLAPAAHYERMKRSANVMRMTLPHSTEELVNFTLELLRRNEFKSDVYVRPLLYTSSEEIGVGLHNLNRAFFIYAVPFGNYVEIEAGIRCTVSSWRRVPDQALPARAKITGSYAQAALAKSEAVENGFDEAIVLSVDGHVSEGSAENLFMLKDGAFITPPVTDDILEGITRQLLMKMINEELNLPVLERSIDRTELYTCDELLLCGTGAQISPVIEVDRRPVGDGNVGEVTQELQNIYFGAVRGDTPKYRDWTIPVY